MYGIEQFTDELVNFISYTFKFQKVKKKKDALSKANKGIFGHQGLLFAVYK